MEGRHYYYIYKKLIFEEQRQDLILLHKICQMLLLVAFIVVSVFVCFSGFPLNNLSRQQRRRMRMVVRVRRREGRMRRVSCVR